MNDIMEDIFFYLLPAQIACILQKGWMSFCEKKENNILLQGLSNERISRKIDVVGEDSWMNSFQRWNWGSWNCLIKAFSILSFFIKTALMWMEIHHA